MKVVKVRSPFMIQVNESTQIGSKIELFIWRNGETEPTVPTYTLSKPIPTSNQRLTSYNVSNFVKEYIENIAPTYVNYPANNETNNNYARFKVKRYWNNAGVYTLLDTISYVGVNGYSDYMDGLQVATEKKIEILFNPTIQNTYQIKTSYSPNTIQYLNVLIEFDDINDLFTIEYIRLSGGYTAPVYFDSSVAGIFLFKIPITLAKIDNNFIKGCKIKLTHYNDVPDTTVIFDNIFTYPIEECKYTPVLCDFINSYGGWQTLTLYKAQTNNVQVKKESYKLMPEAVNYNTLKGQSKSFNHSATKSIKINTGFVDENYSQVLTDLLLSETILLDRKPVKIKTESLELKNVLKDKLINYELDFEYAYNSLNDVL
jgi:hypothetical protein